MAAATTTIKAEGKALKAKDARATKGGRVKYEVTTEDGVLVIAYVPADQARKSLSAFGLRLSGPKAVVQEAEASPATADGLV